MAKRKNNATNTISKEAEAFRAAKTAVLQPPAHLKLRKGDWPYWNAIIANKRRDAWTEADLQTAYILARNTADLIRLHNRLDREGRILAGKPNPIIKMIETLEARMLSMQRQLLIHAHATQGRSEDQVKRNQKAREAGEAMQNDGDSLIAGVLQ